MLMADDDGLYSATNFIDSSDSAHTVTGVNNASLTAGQTVFGTGSLELDGSSYLTVPDHSDFSLGSGDFTIDCWTRLNTNPSGQYGLVSQAVGGTMGWAFTKETSGLGFYYTEDAGVIKGTTQAWSPSTDQWYHLAVARDSHSLKTYVDGIQVGATFDISSDIIDDVNTTALVGSIEDGGSIDGWFDEVRVNIGEAAWTSNFTPPTEPYTPDSASSSNTLDSATVLMLHMDGDDASTTFTDDSSSVHTFTAIGNAQIDTAESKFDGASGLFDGTGDYITEDDHADWYMGTGDCTYDFWIKRNSEGSTTVIFSDCNTVGANYSTRCFFSSDNLLNFDFVLSTTVKKSLTSTSTITISDGWTHIAGVRDGVNLTLYINGIEEDTRSDLSTTAHLNSTGALRIARNGADAVNTYYFNGWLDEFRISKGIARHTDDFTVPTSAYIPDGGIDSNTVLMVHMDGADESTTFTDVSDTGHTITAIGTAQVDTSQSQFGGASVLFDGNSDNLELDSHTDFDFGSGDFTIDFWCRRARTTTSEVLIAKAQSGASTFDERSFQVHFRADNSLSFFILVGLTGYEARTTLTFVSTTVWNHFEFVRTGDTMLVFVNGILEATGSPSGSINTTSHKFTVARIGPDGSSTPAYFSGRIDELRISKGIARHTENFAVQTGEYTSGTEGPQTSLLLHCDTSGEIGEVAEFYSNDYTVDESLKPILSVRYEGGRSVIDVDASERNRIVIPRMLTTNPNSYQAGAAIPVDYFRGGYIKSLEGMNDYVHRHIVGMTMSDTALGLTWDTLLVLPPFPYDLEEMSAIEIAPGCDHNLTDCEDKFNNLTNYGGFPWTPNFDQIY